MAKERQVLETADKGRDTLDRALLDEQLQLMRADEARLKIYAEASHDWRTRWVKIEPTLVHLPLHEAHKQIVDEALCYLPFSV